MDGQITEYRDERSYSFMENYIRYGDAYAWRSRFGGGSIIPHAGLCLLPQLFGWAFVAFILTYLYIEFWFGAIVSCNVAGWEGPSIMVENHAELGNMQDLPYCEYPSELSSFHLLDCAVRIGAKNRHKTLALGPEAPPCRIAFLFLTTGEIPFEPLWRRFFTGYEDFYSIYVHTLPDFTFSNDSMFYGHQVPSEPANRMSITLVDAFRRLLAHSILDTTHGDTNSWFVLVCEHTIPIRSFNFTYNYLTKSQHSFVESFRPNSANIWWFDERRKEPFSREQIRKGEMWMAIELRHALLILEDWNIYYEFKRLCTFWCDPDEQYYPTLLGLKDPEGIENRTLVYVNWEEGHTSSPRTHQVEDLTVEWFQDIRSRTTDLDGQFHDTSLEAQSEKTKRTSRICSYNKMANSTCFLFARKVSGDTEKYLESLPTTVLGY